MFLSSYKFSFEIHSPGEDQILCVAEILRDPGDGRPSGGEGSGGTQHETSKPTFQSLQQQTPIVSGVPSPEAWALFGEILPEPSL